MSTLLADTIRKTGGTGGVDIRVKNTSVYESDGGTSVTQNLAQSLCKAWLSFDQTSPSLIDSLNTASMTDTSAGKYAANWTNNFGNATYMATENTAADGSAYGNYGASSHNSWHRLNSQRTTSLCQGAFYYTDSGSGVYADAKTIEGMFMGDLA